MTLTSPVPREHRFLPGSVLLLLAVCAMLAFPVSAAESVGKVITSRGDVKAVQADGSTRKLRRRSPVHEGDTLVTGENARAQIRFKDGALVSLRPETTFVVKEYKFNGKQDGSERAILNLVKGGMRTISGAIGQENKDNYKMETPVATIGIRGTHYGLRFCQGNCGNYPDGLYGGVVDGGVVASNQGGEKLFNNDQYFHVASLDALPKFLMQPPPIIFDEPVAKGKSGQKKAAKDNGQNAREVVRQKLAQAASTRSGDGEAAPTLANFVDLVSIKLSNSELDEATILAIAQALYDFVTGGGTLSTFSSGEQLSGATPTGTSVGTNTTLAPKGAVAGLAFVADDDQGFGLDGVGEKVRSNPDYIVLDSSTHLPVFISTYQDDCDPCTVRFDQSSPVPTTVGGNTFLKVRWGTWNKGSTRIVVSGTEEHIADSSGVYHGIYSENVTPLTTLANMPAMGVATASYDFGGGQGPQFIDNSGLSYSGYSGTLDVNFVSQDFTNVNININESALSWNITSFQDNMGQTVSKVPIKIGLKNGLYVGGTYNSSTPVEGKISGAFVGDKAQGYMSSIGLRTQDGSKAISGVRLLKRGGF